VATPPKMEPNTNAIKSNGATNARNTAVTVRRVGTGRRAAPLALSPSPRPSVTVPALPGLAY